MAVSGLLLQQAGQGDAYILPGMDMSGLAHVGRMKQAQELAKQKLEAEQRAIRDKRIDEMMRWTPEQAWYPHQQQVDNYVNDVYGQMTQMEASGDMSPQARAELNRRKQVAASASAKSQSLQKQYPQWRQQINEADKYTDKAYLNSRLNDYVFGQDGNADVNNVDFDAINNTVSGRDVNAFKVDDYAADFAKDLPFMVDQSITTTYQAGTPFAEINSYKSKFVKTNADGSVARDSQGRPIINVTDETMNLAKQDPRMAEWLAVKAQETGKSEKELFTGLMSPYATIENKATLQKGFKPSGGRGSGEADKEMVWSYDQEYRTNAGDKSSPDWRTGVHPVEVRMTGKKLDKKILVNSPYIYDEHTNSSLSNKEMVGDRSMKVTRVALVPRDVKTGKWVVGDQATVASNPDYTWEWVAYGELSYKDRQNKEHTKAVFVPYNTVNNDIQSAYDLNLYDRDLKDASNEEIAATINAYYGTSLTPQQKAQIFMKAQETGSIK